MVADSPDEVRVRAREQLMQVASQIKLTAGGGVARRQPARRSPSRKRSFGPPSRLPATGAPMRGARLYVGDDPARDRRRREGHRARAPDGRRHRPAHGRAGHLAEHPALRRRRGRGAVPAGLGPGGAEAGGDRRHRVGLRPGEEVRDPDRVRNRHPLLAGARHPPGRLAGPDGALVLPRRGAEDGDPRQRRASRADGVAQPLSGPPRRRRGGQLPTLLVDGDPTATSTSSPIRATST